MINFINSITSHQANMYRAFELNQSDLDAIHNAEHVLLQSLFVQKKRPRSKMTLIQNNTKSELIGGADIQFLNPALKEPRIECHGLVVHCNYNDSWDWFRSAVKVQDEWTLVWRPDSHTTRQMLMHHIAGDSVILRLYRHGKTGFESVLLSVFMSDTPQHRAVKLKQYPTLGDLNYE